MSHHEPKIHYTRKRRHDENERQAKQMPNPAVQTKLTDMNDDCLEKVFMYLSLKELLNVAHVCKGLKTAADETFRRNFGKKQIYLSNSKFYESEITYHKLMIYDFKLSLWLLRCYGHLITDLTIHCIDYNSVQKYWAHLMQYTSQYCCKTLKTVEFVDMKPAYEALMEKPFLNVETVIFNHCDLGKKISKFNKWFPAIRCLKIYESEVCDRSFIEKHFPHLEQLDLHSFHKYYRRLDKENVIASFRLNPQLRRVNVNECPSSVFLRSISEYLPVLEHLAIPFNPDCFSDGDATIFFKSVKKLKISVAYWYKRKTPHINLLFDQLEEVEMDFGVYIPDIRLIKPMKFFKEHQSITKLKFQVPLYGHSHDTNKDTMMEIMAALPLLNDFTFVSDVNFSIEELIDILAKYKLLKRFCIKVSNPNKFECLSEKLGDTWETSIKRKQIELNRKI